LESELKEILKLELYNISGQLVLEKHIPAFEKDHRINIQNLQSGVYLVKLVSDSQVVYTSKIAKK
jgi:flagellar assembly factor FliW